MAALVTGKLPLSTPSSMGDLNVICCLRVWCPGGCCSRSGSSTSCPLQNGRSGHHDTPVPPHPLPKIVRKKEKDSRQKIIQKEKESEHVHIPFADSFIYKYKVGIIDPLFLGITSSNSELKYLLQKREANSQHKITSQSVTHN